MLMSMTSYLPEENESIYLYSVMFSWSCLWDFHFIPFKPINHVVVDVKKKMSLHTIITFKTLFAIPFRAKFQKHFTYRLLSKKNLEKFMLKSRFSQRTHLVTNLSNSIQCTSNQRLIGGYSELLHSVKKNQVAHHCSLFQVHFGIWN